MPPKVREFRYPLINLWGDVARATFGVVVSFAIAAAVPLGSVPFAIFAIMGAVFAVHCFLTISRVRMRIVMSEDGVSVSPGKAAIVWRELASVRLVYYSTRRDRESGWMQLILANANGRKLRLDSRADGFEVIVRAAVHGASQNALELDAATVHNLSALGISAADISSGLGGDERVSQ